MPNIFTAAVRCLLIPINGGQLLLPCAVVAEVSPYKEPSTTAENQPNWLLGIINWRNQTVPLLSIEEALSLSVMTPSAPKYRTVILYGLESSQMMPFYAFRAIDMPRTLNITEDSLSHPNADARMGLVFNVKVHNTEVGWLPDLTYLENLLIKSRAFNFPR